MLSTPTKRIRIENGPLAGRRADVPADASGFFFDVPNAPVRTRAFYATNADGGTASLSRTEIIAPDGTVTTTWE